MWKVSESMLGVKLSHAIATKGGDAVVPQGAYLPQALFARRRRGTEHRRRIERLRTQRRNHRIERLRQFVDGGEVIVEDEPMWQDALDFSWLPTGAWLVKLTVRSANCRLSILRI